MLLAGSTVEPANAQVSAEARQGNPVIEYSRNESGGRISLAYADADSTTMADQRLGLLELAAAIRRGDFRAVWVVPSGHPSLQILAQHRNQLRCTLRLTAKGAELVLLSDDDVVVAAIHQVLSSTPPRATRL